MKRFPAAAAASLRWQVQLENHEELQAEGAFAKSGTFSCSLKTMSRLPRLASPSIRTATHVDAKTTALTVRQKEYQQYELPNAEWSPRIS